MMRKLAGVVDVFRTLFKDAGYVEYVCEVAVRCADISQLCHPVGKPNYGGRLHLQPGFVRLQGMLVVITLLLCISEIYPSTTDPRAIHMPF